MKTRERISLLVPCHNARPYLSRLLECARRQTHPFDEIICYDDNSTDGTADLAREQGIPVVTATEPSTGPAAARNRLAAAATGDWLHFHDADDLMAEPYAERLLAGAAAADVAYCDADWLEEESRRLLIAWRYDDAAMNSDPLSYLIRHPVGINNGIFRRTVFNRIGGFDETLRMWEDADLYIRLAAAGARLRHVPGIWTQSLRHSDSLSHAYVENWNCRVTALARYADRYPAARAAVGSEAERAADELLALGDNLGARKALAICRQLRWPVPSGGGPLVAIARAVVPATILLRARHRRRTQPC